jgi:DNA helicase-2/ATP-dependent DNA helicase PcrA
MLDLTNFNPNQKTAVVSKSKRLLVLAGAGSGKTKVLTSRIVYLLESNINASNIMAVTFTNKAANEMKERVQNMVDFDTVAAVDDMWIGTFHSTCNRLLRRYYSKPNYEIMDSSDQKSFVKRVLKGMAFNDIKADTVNKSLAFISEAKNKFLTPMESAILNEKYPEIQYPNKIYEEYETQKSLMNVFDFDDLLFKTVALLKERVDVQTTLQNNFEHILVDEYQDTNDLQELFLQLLLRPNYSNSLFVVGDDDQSIYGWRGAKVENILGFGDKYNNSELIKLEENYRSTAHILTAANAVISNNAKRLGKELYTQKDNGPKITVYKAESPENESKFVVSCVAKTLAKDVAPTDIAISYRSNFISRGIESALTEANIPYIIIGGVSFWERQEIKDALSYFSVIVNGNNNIQTERAMGLLKGIGKKTIEKIIEYANDNEIPIYDAFYQMFYANHFKGKSKTIFKEFLDLIENGKQLIQTPYSILTHIVENSGLVNYYKEKEGDEKGVEREENLNELVYFSEKFYNQDPKIDDINAFLGQISLQMDLIKNKKDNKNAIQLMTLHAAKGLEFPYFFVAGVEQGVFPSNRSLQDSKGLEEERRLMYVAITRAMGKLCLSYAAYRFGFNDKTGISDFVKELPKAILESNDDELIDYSDVPYEVGDAYYDERYGDGEILFVKKNMNQKVTLTIDFCDAGRKNIIIDL